ncbi:hypothetical protein BBP40_002521 [Aspergillus hancockii]|nr:hypothetical protein BBP40_002521 [Aspergillus hancockii]
MSSDKVSSDQVSSDQVPSFKVPSDQDNNDPKYSGLGPPLHDPDLNEPMVKLADLPEPPDRYLVCGRTLEEAAKARKFTSAEAKDVVRFHGWGIDMGIQGNSTTFSCIKALWKLFYHQADKHRPQNFDEIKDFTRDAGPRLFQCSINIPDFLPISRYYPRPPPEHKTPEPGYHRPFDALDGRLDSYIEQMLYPVFGGPKEISNGPTELEAPRPPMTSHVAGNRNQHKMRLPQAMARSVIEAVEKTILQFAYEDLARHPSAASQDGQVHLVASTEEDLRKANIGSFPATSYVSLAADYGSSNGLVFSPDGDEYPYRGRGPVYRNNSSSIDSMIVVGKLLDAGSTVLDRKDTDWRERFTNVEKAFIEATETNWDLCSRGDSRDRFWAVLAAETENVGVGVQSPLLDMWRTATDHFGQFLFSYQEKIFFCGCTNTDPAEALYTSTIVQPPTRPEDQKTGVSMQQLVARSFAPEYVSPCGLCRTTRGVTCWKKFRSIPMRLAITLDGNVPVKKHTQDISIDYITDRGQRGTASYRWLGGIYCKDGHYRVYWTDHKRGETDSGEIRVYDSAMVSGVIVGGIPQAHRDDKVPQEWWKNKPVPLIFYERIMNPDDEVINVALHALYDLAKIRDQRKLLLQGYVSWAPSNPPKSRVNFNWRRLIDRQEDRFHSATGAYDPAGHGEALNRGSGAVPRFSSPVRVNLEVSASPRPEPEAQPEAEVKDGSLFNTPTPSILNGLFTLPELPEPSALPDVSGVADGTVLPSPIGLFATQPRKEFNGQLAQPYIPPNGQHHDPYNTPFDTQPSAQHNVQSNGQYLGQCNTQANGQQRDQFSTNNSQPNAQQQGQYNTQHITQSNGHRQGQYNGQYSTRTSISDLLSIRDPSDTSYLDNVFETPEYTPGAFLSPTPSRANGTNKAQASTANNFNNPHHRHSNRGLMSNHANNMDHAKASIVNNFNYLHPNNGRRASRTHPSIANNFNFPYQNLGNGGSMMAESHLAKSGESTDYGQFLRTGGPGV